MKRYNEIEDGKTLPQTDPLLISIWILIHITQAVSLLSLFTLGWLFFGVLEHMVFGESVLLLKKRATGTEHGAVPPASKDTHAEELEAPKPGP